MTKNFKIRTFTLLINLAAIGLMAIFNPAFSSDEKKENAYPLDTCIVSGEKLGSMGDPVKYDHDGQEIQFCCKMCIKKFESDTEGYLKKMDQAVMDKKIAEYPLTTCVVSDEPLESEEMSKEMGPAFDYMHEGQLVRFCCKMCKSKFLQDPDTYLKKIDDAAKAAHKDKKMKMDKDSSDGHEKKSDQSGHEGHNH